MDCRVRKLRMPIKSTGMVSNFFCLFLATWHSRNEYLSPIQCNLSKINMVKLNFIV